MMWRSFGNATAFSLSIPDLSHVWLEEHVSGVVKEEEVVNVIRTLFQPRVLDGGRELDSFEEIYEQLKTSRSTSPDTRRSCCIAFVRRRNMLYLLYALRTRFTDTLRPSVVSEPVKPVSPYIVLSTRSGNE